MRWHVNCNQPRSLERMATKMRVMKLLQEIRGLAQVTQRRPHNRAPGLFLLQLRSHVNQATSRRQRLVIPVQMHEPPDIPNPVKIKISSRQDSIPTPVS